MPIRTFICKDGHETERILFGDSDKNTRRTKCDTCKKPASRQDTPARTGTPILKQGCGGFYKPNSR